LADLILEVMGVAFSELFEDEPGDIVDPNPESDVGES
jgi:hypothetical protein